MAPFLLWREAYAKAKKSPNAAPNALAKLRSDGVVDVVNPKLFPSTSAMSWAMRFVAINYNRSVALDSWLRLFSPHVSELPSKLEEHFNSFGEASTAYSQWLGRCIKAYFDGKETRAWNAWFKSSQTVEDIWFDVVVTANTKGLMQPPPPKPKRPMPGAAESNPSSRRRFARGGRTRRASK